MWKALIFGALILLGTLTILGALADNTLRGKIGGTLSGLALVLPGLWFFLHERRANAGATPMKRHWLGVTGACIALFASGIAVIPPAEKPAEEPKTLVSIPTSTATPTLKPTTSTSETKPAEPLQDQTPKEEQQAPAPEPAQVPEPTPAPAPEIEGVKPGAFCPKSQIGQTATGTNGRTYTCTSNGNGKAHWR